MAYTIGGDGLLDFSGCESDEEKLDQCWDYFCEQLNDIEVRWWGSPPSPLHPRLRLMRGLWPSNMA